MMIETLVLICEPELQEATGKTHDFWVEMDIELNSVTGYRRHVADEGSVATNATMVYTTTGDFIIDIPFEAMRKIMKPTRVWYR
jgi:hypothetical protein